MKVLRRLLSLNNEWTGDENLRSQRVQWKHEWEENSRGEKCAITICLVFDLSWEGEEKTNEGKRLSVNHFLRPDDVCLYFDP